jgi:hypothetical protein
VYLPTQGSSIPPAGAAFPAGNIGLYSATNSTTTLNELYINKYINLPSANTTVQIPITAFGYGSISSSPATAASWAYFPSGMLQISGQVTGSGNITITFANGSANGVAGFPGFSNYISSIQVTRVDASGTVNNFPIVRSYSLTGCVVSLSNGGSGTIFWTATGI